jgi:low temperature requirement protein LtrA
MSHDPTWAGIAKGLAVLGVLWWSWGGYAWLTSVVDPEEGAVRLVMFGAMAAMLVAALGVPGAFGSTALLFACAYGVVRAAHIMLFLLASRDDPDLRKSVAGLAVSTAVGVGLLLAAAFAGEPLRGVLWGVALLLDVGGPFLFGAEGWKLVPGHFAERHGAIIIIALGESIVAIGVGASPDVDAGVVVAAVLGTVVAAALWWTYFDVVALVAARRLGQAAEGRERNEMARDSYSYIHYLMVAGIVLIALGLKKTLAHVGDPLTTETAVAMLGARRSTSWPTSPSACGTSAPSTGSAWSAPSSSSPSCRSPSTLRRSPRSRSSRPCSRRSSSTRPSASPTPASGSAVSWPAERGRRRSGSGSQIPAAAEISAAISGCSRPELELPTWGWKSVAR